MSLSLFAGEMRLYDLCRHIGLQKSSELFRNLRPDIVLLKRDSLVSIELTVVLRQI